MGWKFWKKNEEAGGKVAKSAKLPKPKELPEHIGMHLVVKEKLDPDWVWSLKCAKFSRAGEKSLFDFRIFSESQADAAGVHVTNYNALDDHADLILYHGHSDKRGYIFHIEKGVSDKAA